jgi:YHS domain-containing protein
MQVDEKTAPAKATYGGRTYYFCATECKDKFTANPQKYAKESMGAQ